MTREKSKELLDEANKYLQNNITGKEWDDIQEKYIDKIYKFIDTAKFEFKIANEKPSITLYAKLTDGNKTQIESLERVVNYFRTLKE